MIQHLCIGLYGYLPLEGVPFYRGHPRANRGRVLKERNKHRVLGGGSAQRGEGGRRCASAFLHGDGLWLHGILMLK